MANNGDITHADIEQFIELGGAFPASSDTTLTEDDVDQICNGINADVNLILRRLGFALPITDSDSVEWLELTKKFGAGSLTLDGLASQNTEEENTRAERYWDKYMARLNELIESGGDILNAEVSDDPRPSMVPVLAGEFTDQGLKRHLRFPQRAAADHYDHKQAIRRSRASWSGAIKGW